MFECIEVDFNGIRKPCVRCDSRLEHYKIQHFIFRGLAVITKTGYIM